MMSSRGMLFITGIFCAAVLLSGDGLARGTGGTQENSGSELKTAENDSTKVKILTFQSKSSLKFTEGYYLGETGMSSTFNAYGGWILNSNLTISKKKFRGRDMDLIMENFMNSAVKVVPGTYNLNLSIGKIYSKQVSSGMAKYGKEIVMEDESAALSYIYSRATLGADKTEGHFTGKASMGQQDFKFNKTMAVQAGGYQNYSIGDKIGVGGGFGTTFKREQSDIGAIEFKGITSRVDTLRAGFEIGGKGEKFLKVKYSRKMGVLRQIDPPFGNSMQALDNPEDAQEEENRIKGETLHLESAIKPMKTLSIKVTFDHNYSDEKFVVENRRNKEMESNNLEATASYKYSTNGSLGITMKRGESVTEFGPTSVASYSMKNYALNGSWKHSIHDSLDISLTGTMTLKQKFYVKKEQNPRDVDHLFSSIGGKINAYLFRVIKTAIAISASRREIVNIDATLSGDNRADYQYLLVPEFSIRPATWIAIKQKYEIKMDYTEYSFDPDRNYLNRNTVLVTDASFRLLPPLRFSLNHRYQMKDTGSYLAKDGGERLYGPTNQNLEHKLKMNLKYTPAKDTAFFIQAQFKDQVNNSIGFVDGKRVIRSSSLSESGDFRIGLERKQNVTESGKLDLNITYVKKYAPFLSEDRRQYWDIQANFTLDF